MLWFCAIILRFLLLNCVFIQLKSNPEIYDGYVPMEYDEYLDKMSK